MPIGLLYLDEGHLEDLLLVQRLAQVLKRLPAPLVLVHGSGGRAEQLLEAEGYGPERRAGVLVAHTDRERMLIERGIRETNQRLVAGLNELLIPAVGIQGSDRGLLRRERTGALQVGRVAWLTQLLHQGVWPVVSTLVQAATQQVVEAPAAEVLSALASAWASDAVVLLLTDRQGGVADVAVATACQQQHLKTWHGRLEKLPEALKQEVF